MELRGLVGYKHAEPVRGDSKATVGAGGRLCAGCRRGESMMIVTTRCFESELFTYLIPLAVRQ